MGERRRATRQRIPADLTPPPIENRVGDRVEPSVDLGGLSVDDQDRPTERRRHHIEDVRELVEYPLADLPPVCFHVEPGHGQHEELGHHYAAANS